MLNHTGSKGALYLACVLVLGVACSDAELDAKPLSNAATARDSSTDDLAAADAGAADAGSVDAGLQPTAAGTSGLGGGQSLRSEPWRVVPLGDSITELSCTSQLLWQSLRQGGAKSFDMIGTQRSNQDCGVDEADRDSEGHAGYRATDLIDDGKHAAEFSSWCDADRGEVVLMHLGTNDISQANLPPETILDAYSKILHELRARQPKVTVFVAQIIPMKPGNCDYCYAQGIELNEQIPAWAARENQAASPVYVVDQFSDFDVATDTGDGVHPNKQGAQKMADKWSAAVRKHLQL